MWGLGGGEGSGAGPALVKKRDMGVGPDLQEVCLGAMGGSDGGTGFKGVVAERIRKRRNLLVVT